MFLLFRFLQNVELLYFWLNLFIELDLDHWSEVVLITTETGRNTFRLQFLLPVLFIFLFNQSHPSHTLLTKLTVTNLTAISSHNINNLIMANFTVSIYRDIILFLPFSIAFFHFIFIHFNLTRFQCISFLNFSLFLLLNPLF